MLKAADLVVKFEAATVVRGLALEVKPGEAAALVGPNGAGKTTTLKAVMGIYRHGGSVWLNGVDVTNLAARDRAKLGMGYSPEDRGLFPSLTVRENLELPVKALRLPEDRVEVALTYVEEVKKFMDKKAGLLSGGQQKLVALARALVVGRSALLLDELFEGLSPKMADAVKLSLRAYLNDHKPAALLAESTTSYLKGLASRVYYIERGEVVRVSEEL
ncbi:MAG: ATP-binding cassette domain-containing protein [Pyrobaculum sp.]